MSTFNLDLKATGWQRGTKKFGRLQVATLPDGSVVDVPIALVCGQKKEPRLWLQAATHGDELDGVYAAINVLNELDEKKLQGTIVVIPVANTLAFRSLLRVAPIDYKDMNRIWNTSVENVGYVSAYSEIVAQKILEQLHAFDPDYLIDLHGGGRSVNLVPYVEYALAGKSGDKKAENLAKATRMRVIWRNKDIRFKGALSFLMSSKGIPSIVIESGGPGGIEDRSSRVFEAILNCMSHLSMIPSRAGEEPTERIFVEKGNWIRPKISGIWHQLCESGSIVTKGQVLARISDVFGETIETITAPVDGIVIGIRTGGLVRIGEYGGNVGTIAE